MKILKPTLIVIGTVQLALGVMFLVPGLFASVMGLPSGPGWTDWMFAMLGARAIGFAFGMFVTSRDPRAHLSWITAMIAVQTIDWVATLAYLATGSVTIAQVTTAAFLPVVFVSILVRYSPRRVDVEVPARTHSPIGG
ncbi:MAG: hypothetical protein R2687_05720 [Candidatus Nanopelagicales bacterium]